MIYKDKKKSCFDDHIKFIQLKDSLQKDKEGKTDSSLEAL
jgi:hypothetical protein